MTITLESTKTLIRSELANGNITVDRLRERVQELDHEEFFQQYHLANGGAVAISPADVQRPLMITAMRAVLEEVGSNA